MRFLLGLAGLAALAFVFAEVVAVGLLYSRGQLDDELLADLRRAVTGEPEPEAELPEEPEGPSAPSWQEVLEERALALASLRTREEELAALRELLARQADELADRRDAFDADRDAFRAELAALAAETASEATARARGIVEAAPPAVAVNYLMGLETADDVRIVTGIPAKTMTKILQEFARGADPQRERGQEIFNALADGGARADLIDAARATDDTPPRTAAADP